MSDAEDAERDLAKDVLLAELEFVQSLITTYREFQIQAVGFSALLYSAVLGVIGAAIDSSSLDKLLSYCTALLPLVVAVLVLAFTVMEVRIRRASRHIELTIAPKIERLRPIRCDPQLLEWEQEPNRHLNRFERRMASSAIFVMAMSVPALVAAGWHLFMLEIADDSRHDMLALLGAVLLFAAAAAATVLSGMHEARKRDKQAGPPVYASDLANTAPATPPEPTAKPQEGT